jgi:hypothetical protein
MMAWVPNEPKNNLYCVTVSVSDLNGLGSSLILLMSAVSLSRSA